MKTIDNSKPPKKGMENRPTTTKSGKDALGRASKQEVTITKKGAEVYVR